MDRSKTIGYRTLASRRTPIGNVYSRPARLLSFVDIEKARTAYYSQMSHAKARGIGWEITFQEWLDWWGEDLDRRGRGKDQLSMQRIRDRGPYKLGNIEKGYPRDNAHTRSVMHGCHVPNAVRKHETKHEYWVGEDGRPDQGYYSVWNQYGLA